MYIAIKNSFLTSQETHYVSATKPNRLMLFRETVAVYCENHTEHTNNIEFQFVPHRKHYVSATKPNRLMLFRETVAVYCENHTEHINTLRGQNAEFFYVKAGGTYEYLYVIYVPYASLSILRADYEHEVSTIQVELM
jgi:hypothetical protein